MFCCRGREKRGDNEKTISRKEMVERFILQTCKQDDEDSFDNDDKSTIKIIDYDNNQYEKKPWSSAQWQMIIQTKLLKTIDKQELKQNVKFGILQNLRPATWFWMTDIYNTQIIKHNPQIYNKLKGYESKFDQQIFKAIKNIDKRYQDYVFDILRAYANYDVEIGYVKDVEIIIQYIIQQLDPEQYLNIDYSYNSLNRIPDFYDQMVFWMSVHVLFQLDYRKVLRDKISFIENEKFDNTLSPQIKDLLKQQQCSLNKLIGTPLMFYFQKQLNKEDFNKLFDIFLLEGESVLQRVLLKLIKISENIICQFQTEIDLKTFLNQSMVSYGISQINKTNQKIMNYLLQ